MNLITTMYDAVRTISSNLTGRASYPGYRMTERSRRAWDKLEADKAQVRIDEIVNKTRRMIEQSYTEYEYALAKHKHNMKVYTELTLHWSPQRVLSKHRHFSKLCDALNDDVVWKKLSRKERAFIADSVRLK